MEFRAKSAACIMLISLTVHLANAAGDAPAPTTIPTTLPATEPSSLMQRAVVSDPGWEARFTKVYSIAPDEVLKFVPWLSVPERNDYWERRLDYFTTKAHEDLQKDRMAPHFEWEFFFFLPPGGRNAQKVTITSGLVIHPVASQQPGLNKLLKLLRQGTFRSDLPVVAPTLDNLDLRGDWIVRKSVAQANVLDALAQIIQDQTHRSVQFEKSDDGLSFTVIEEISNQPGN